MFILGIAVGAGCLFGYNKFLTNDSIVEDKNTEDETVENGDDVPLKDKSQDIYSTIMDDKNYYNPSFGNGNDIIFTLNGSDTTKVSFSVNRENISKGSYVYYGVKINSTELYLKGDIILDQPVKSISFGGAGQSASDKDCYLFLMQDGTVRYLNIVDALTSTEFTAAYNALPQPKIIEGLNDIETIYGTIVVSKDPTVIAGHADTVAIKKDETMIKILDYIK